MVLLAGISFSKASYLKHSYAILMGYRIKSFKDYSKILLFNNNTILIISTVSSQWITSSAKFYPINQSALLNSNVLLNKFWVLFVQQNTLIS